MLVLHAQIEFNDDSEVIGPEHTPENVCQVIREMRKATPSQISHDAESTLSDLLVLARIYHTVFTEVPDAVWWPVLSRHDADCSLLAQALLWAGSDDWEVFYRAEPEDYLAAANVVRWILGERQQPHALLVLRDLPLDLDDIEPWHCPEQRVRLAVG